jgi:hypothetical protein
MQIIVDRIEGEWAVLEIGEHRVNLPLAAFPSPPQEGARITLQVERLRQASPPSDSFDI